MIPLPRFSLLLLATAPLGACRAPPPAPQATPSKKWLPMPGEAFQLAGRDAFLIRPPQSAAGDEIPCDDSAMSCSLSGPTQRRLGARLRDPSSDGRLDLLRPAPSEWLEEGAAAFLLPECLCRRGRRDDVFPELEDRICVCRGTRRGGARKPGEPAAR